MLVTIKYLNACTRVSKLVHFYQAKKRQSKDRFGDGILKLNYDTYSAVGTVSILINFYLFSDKSLLVVS